MSTENLKPEVGDFVECRYENRDTRSGEVLGEMGDFLVLKTKPHYKSDVVFVNVKLVREIRFVTP